MCDSTFTTSVSYRNDNIGYDTIVLTLIQLSDGASIDIGSEIVVPVVSIPNVPKSLIRYTLKKQLYDYFIEKFETDLKYLNEIYTHQDIEGFATEASIITLEKVPGLQ